MNSYYYRLLTIIYWMILVSRVGLYNKNFLRSKRYGPARCGLPENSSHAILQKQSKINIAINSETSATIADFFLRQKVPDYSTVKSYARYSTRCCCFRLPVGTVVRVLLFFSVYKKSGNKIYFSF